MSIFINHFTDLFISDFLQVVDCHFEVLLIDMMQNNHLEVVFLLSELDNVLNSSMRLHDAVNKIFI
jgi:hypothetical protein